MRPGYVLMLRRFLVVFALAVWFGGFTFYAAVVIPTGHEVLGSHREVGFLTQQVTQWLNLIGIAALSILLWNVGAVWPAAHARLRLWLAASLAVMAAAQIALFLAHPRLGTLLDAEAHRILIRDRFYGAHRVYLMIATAQWLATLVHICSTLAGWRTADRQASRPENAA